MKKLIVVLILLIVVGYLWKESQCVAQDAPGQTIVKDPNDVWLIALNEWTEPVNISFCFNGIEVLFEWKDSKFNVVYDRENCTESAHTFFVCIEPYLNGHIEEKAKELLIIK